MPLADDGANKKIIPRAVPHPRPFSQREKGEKRFAEIISRLSELLRPWSATTRRTTALPETQTRRRVCRDRRVETYALRSLCLRRRLTRGSGNRRRHTLYFF